MSALSHRLLLVFSFGFFTLFSYAQITKEQAQEIDQVFAKWNRTDRPGAALAVVHNGTIVYEKGYGMADLEHGIAIGPETVFYIGSVSKQFVAMCMLLLEEEGKVDLDADIRTYLPEFPDYGTPITSRNLIHHTSGIRDNLTLWELKGRSHLDEIPESEIYELIRRQEKLNFEPGTEYRYSNSCYFMMSLIVERVTGQSLRAYADEHIFKPLGMSHTFFGDDNKRIIRNRAFGYNENREGEIENMIMRFDLVGSGGLYSNVQDLFLWDQNFYHNKLGKRGQALIDDMLTNGKYKDGSEVDYAFAVVNGQHQGLRTVSHSGALGGYRAFYVQFPGQQFSVIILGNVTTLNPTDLAYAVADICLADQMKPKTVDKEDTTASLNTAAAEKTAPTLSGEALKAYPGRFYSPELDFHYDLELKDDQLILQIGETEALTLQPVSETRFETESGLGLEFIPGKKGKMDQFLLDAGRVSGLRFEREK
jgi:CubicO group peptidase (beta-lactamase class C family)